MGIIKVSRWNELGILIPKHESMKKLNLTSAAYLGYKTLCDIHWVTLYIPTIALPSPYSQILCWCADGLFRCFSKYPESHPLGGSSPKNLLPWAKISAAALCQLCRSKIVLSKKFDLAPEMKTKRKPGWQARTNFRKIWIERDRW